MTTRRTSGLLFVVGLVMAAACQDRHRDLARNQTALPSGVAALVGTDSIDTEIIVRIAKASEIPLSLARDRAIFDALLAAGARVRFGPLAAHRAETSASARALLQSFASEARAAGPPNDTEVAEVTETRWWELDRPPLRRTTHAVVVLEKPEQEKGARGLAERIAVAVAPATDAASFRALATAVSAPGLKVKVEDLDPVAEDGRAVNPAAPPPPGSQTGRYSPAYVSGAFAVPGARGVSPVVRSEFGFHVIFVAELLPEQRVPLEERRRLLEPEVLMRRASKLETGALEHARAVDPVDVERSALDVTEKVNVLP
jgi:hypothetical protein